MARKLFTNNANTTLAASISAGATTMAVTSGGGALFPVINGGNTFNATLQHVVGGAVVALEIVTVSFRTGDTMGILRAQEGTAAQAWAAGDVFALLPTAADLTLFMQQIDMQQQTATYANDTGTANNYVAAVTPNLIAHNTGAAIRWEASNANTGASTFNDGFGTGNLIYGSSPLVPGMILPGQIYITAWDGGNFQLLNPSTPAFFTGQFNGVLTGVTGTPSNIFHYNIINGICVLSCPSGLAGASISTVASITGLPNVCVPASGTGRQILCLVQNLSLPMVGSIAIPGTAGAAMNLACGLTQAAANPQAMNIGTAQFTSGVGNKGIPPGWTVTYDLN